MFASPLIARVSLMTASGVMGLNGLIVSLNDSIIICAPTSQVCEKSYRNINSKDFDRCPSGSRLLITTQHIPLPEPTHAFEESNLFKGLGGEIPVQGIPWKAALAMRLGDGSSRRLVV